jgi:hypothetical protein
LETSQKTVETKNKPPNKALYLTAFPLRSKAAGELGRLAVEVPIEKYEKTAMQWLQEQT